MNKIILAQVNTIAGDVKRNSELIIKNINKAVSCGADAVAFPQNALTGLEYGDIAKRHKAIIKKQKIALDEIASASTNITAFVGFLNENGKSAVAIISNQKLIKIVDFSQIVQIDDENYGILINSDEKSTAFDNVKAIFVFKNIQNRLGSEYKKDLFLKELAKKNAANVIHVNAVGYANNKCFDGTSRIYSANGELVLRAKMFEQDFAISENFTGKIEEMPIGAEKPVNSEFSLDYSNDLERIHKAITFSIKEYFSKNGFSKAVLGLSGGLDSTICATLLVDALGKDNVVGVSMPSRLTSNESKSDAQQLAENLRITFFEVPLAQAMDTMKGMLNGAFDKIKMEKYAESTTIENLQARTRATILWSISNEFKGMLPIATSDKSEAYIGYATVNGDMSGGFAPIADVTKTKLFALGDYLNKNRTQKNAIPQSVLEKPPGAELKINPKTGKTINAEEANMPYEFLDEIVWQIENNNIGFDELMKHKFYYEKNHELSQEQKEEWLKKFYWKMHCAVYKWHILPPSVIIDTNSINQIEYSHPIISQV